MLEGRRDRDAALRATHAFSAAHRWKYECMLQTQHAIPRLRPRALRGMAQAHGARRRRPHWAFRHYLRIAPPAYALPAPPAARAPGRRARWRA